MAKVDMHVHSKYSEHPSEWFLQRLGANESYTEPEFIYQQAKSQGMDFVTITDHNCLDGALLLQEAHPTDVFTGVEATAYFPDNGCKIHILIYGLNETEFNDIQKFRSDIFDLRAYLQARQLPHSVAHATFSENNRLNLEKLEQLILLFDSFEGINGSRNRLNNHGWMQALETLTPERLERLQAKYRISPFSDTPWLKTFTGGSDDHAGLFIGQTFTQTAAATPDDFLEALKQKKTQAGGRSNDFRAFAFTIYKIAYDFSQSQTQTQNSNGWMSLLHSLVFDPKPLGIKNRLKLNSLKWSRPSNNIHLHFRELLESLKLLKDLKAGEKLPLVYDRLANIADEFLRLLFKSFERDLKNGDLTQLVMNLSASLPGFFLSLPFFTTLKHMHRDRILLNSLAAAYGTPQALRTQKALWFCDRPEEAAEFPALLPVSERFHISETTHLSFAAVMEENTVPQVLPPNVLALPGILNQSISELISLRVPSLLKALEKIEDYDPDVIYISTFGPAGWLGLLAARLMKVKVIGIFQQDLALHFKQTVTDEGAAELADSFCRWFFGAMDEIRVPSRIYRDRLEARGYPADKLVYVPFGLDTQKYAPRSGRTQYLQKKYWPAATGAKLLYVRQPGDGQDFAFACTLLQTMLVSYPQLQMAVLGEPHPGDIDCEPLVRGRNLTFTGIWDPEMTCDLFTTADLLLHPAGNEVISHVVMKAQACGLPVLISNQGGGREIVAQGQSGWILPAYNKEAWSLQLERVLELCAFPEHYQAIRRLARQRMVSLFDWENAGSGNSPFQPFEQWNPRQFSKTA
jgi:glycosyltransferase involved in cell wall biosynthesis